MKASRLSPILQKLFNHSPSTLPFPKRPSAICIPIVSSRENDLRFLLTKRQTTLRSYPEDYCFPGGRKDDADESLEYTAKRELREELGISSDKYQVVAQLDDFKNGYGYLVRPFVLLMHDLNYEDSNCSNGEVSKFVVVSISDLEEIKDKSKKRKSKRDPAYEYKLPNGETVWGLTASVITHIENIIFERNQPIDKECSGTTMSHL